MVISHITFISTISNWNLILSSKLNELTSCMGAVGQKLSELEEDQLHCLSELESLWQNLKTPSSPEVLSRSGGSWAFGEHLRLSDALGNEYWNSFKPFCLFVYMFQSSVIFYWLKILISRWYGWIMKIIVPLSSLMNHFQFLLIKRIFCKKVILLYYSGFFIY